MPQAPTSLGLPRPAGSDRVADGYDAIADLADAVNTLIVADRARLTALEALTAGTRLTALEAINAGARLSALEAFPDFTDTGTITTGFVPSAGWTTVNASYRILGGIICFLHIQCTRTGTTLTGSSSGNISDDQPIITPVPARPNRDLRCLYARGNFAAGSAVIASSGSVQLETLYPTATIAAGDQITIDYAYFLTS